MRALPHGAVADAIATVQASPASVTTKDACELLVLTPVRSGEVHLATSDGLDLDTGVWAIPAARMKAKRDHRVPLSSQALAILHDVQRLSNGTGLVFRSLRGKPLSSVTLSRLTRELGIAAVPHGFRSSFRDWAAEHTNTPREVVEAALAHTVQNPTEAAYILLSCSLCVRFFFAMVRGCGSPPPRSSCTSISTASLPPAKNRPTASCRARPWGSSRGVVARIVTGPHDANRQDAYLPRRDDTGRPRAISRLRISQPGDGLTPLPGWAPGAKTSSDDGRVSEERILHPTLTMVP